MGEKIWAREIVIFSFVFVLLFLMVRKIQRTCAHNMRVLDFSLLKNFLFLKIKRRAYNICSPHVRCLFPFSWADLFSATCLFPRFFTTPWNLHRKDYFFEQGFCLGYF